MAAVTLFFVLYGVVFLWFHVPFGSPLFRWQADANLVIKSVPEQSASLLSSGDVVLAIGGESIVRGQPFYPLPLATDYEFEVFRQGKVVSVIVPVYAPINMTVVSMLLPTTVLSLVGWFAGIIMLFWARRDNYQALYAGYIFLLAAVVLIGVQGVLDGVPGAWIAQSLIFILTVGWIYLGTIPRANQLPWRIRNFFGLLLIIAVALSCAMVYEAIFLFPQKLSFQELIGISLYRSGLFISSLGLIVCVFLLILRIFHLPSTSYIRQQLAILLVFFAIGVFPAAILTIIPRALFDIVILPFPVAITLMIFIPAGYLFVIYRKGLLGLDPFFSRTIYLALLSLLVFSFYTGGLYLVLRWLNLEGAVATVPATIIFFPTLLLTIYASKPVNELVQSLLYGHNRIGNETLANITLSLSARPELATMEQILEQLVRSLDVSKAMLLVKNEKGKSTLAAAIGVESTVPIVPEPVSMATYPILRTAVRSLKEVSQLFLGFTWAELFIPIVARNEQVGLLALACPGKDGYFNAHQVAFLIQAAGVIGVCSENITLFETTRALSRQSLVVREQERKQLAALIHDDPLQQITYATNVLEQKVITPSESSLGENPEWVELVVTQLRSATKTLRHICLGLYPPFWDQGVELAVRDIVSQFKRQKNMRIDFTITGSDQDWSSETVTASTGHILVECLNNVVKHGAGATVWVSLCWTQTQMILQVKDDGPGSKEVTLSYSDLLRRQHMGIAGMHEWAKLVDGKLYISANEPTGIKVKFTCPL